jgi:hypothetical protein
LGALYWKAQQLGVELIYLTFPPFSLSGIGAGAAYIFFA